MHAFDRLIIELGQEMGIPLSSDPLQACRLYFSEPNLFIQIDLSTHGEEILLGSELGILEAGSFRDQILRQALCMNSLHDDYRGILAYSRKNTSLVLFESIPLFILSGATLHRIILQFLETATQWKQALDHQQVPAIEKSFSLPPPSFMRSKPSI